MILIVIPANKAVTSELLPSREVSPVFWWHLLQRSLGKGPPVTRKRTKRWDKTLLEQPVEWPRREHWRWKAIDALYGAFLAHDYPSSKFLDPRNKMKYNRNGTSVNKKDKMDAIL